MKISLKREPEKAIESENRRLRENMKIKSIEDCNVTILESVDSTNEYIKKLDCSAAPQVVIAKEQTKGKGTKGRSFYSPKGGLYLSFAFKPEYGLEDAMQITVKTGEIVKDIIRKYSDDEPYIKPVNDIYIEGKKVAGILTEADTTGVGKFSRIIIGIGINCFENSFPEEISEIATYIKRPAKDFTIDELVRDIVNALISNLLSD